MDMSLAQGSAAPIPVIVGIGLFVASLITFCIIITNK
jgi:hypothetical protein